MLKTTIPSTALLFAMLLFAVLTTSEARDGIYLQPIVFTSGGKLSSTLAEAMPYENASAILEAVTDDPATAATDGLVVGVRPTIVYDSAELNSLTFAEMQSVLRLNRQGSDPVPQAVLAQVDPKDILLFVADVLYEGEAFECCVSNQASGLAQATGNRVIFANGGMQAGASEAFAGTIREVWGRVLAHEIAHNGGLLHLGSAGETAIDMPGNLMQANPSPDTNVAMFLEESQRSRLVSSLRNQGLIQDVVSNDVTTPQEPKPEDPKPEDIIQPSDPVQLVSGADDGDGSSGPPPGAEGVANAIDNSTSKYLNFLDLGSGLIVTPSAGATTVTGLKLYTANDVVARDPASYRLEGSVAGAAGPWSPISQGSLALPDGRNHGGQAIAFEQHHQAITFQNSWAYTAYRLTFPTLKDAGGTSSMQIGEIEFIGVTGGTLAASPPDNGSDSDLDGTPNAVEIATGTDPNNASSFFQVKSVTKPGWLTWNTTAGTVYNIEHSSDLVTWTLIGTVEGDPGQTAVYDPDTGRLSKATGYYRVSLPK